MRHARTIVIALADAPTRSIPALTVKTIQVKVKPNARTSQLAQQPDGTWLASVKAAPVDGKANEELIALVARHFGARKSDVNVKSGASGRMKLIQIEE